MTQINRRDFLKALSLSMGALAANQLLSGCGKSPEATKITAVATSANAQQTSLPATAKTPLAENTLAPESAPLEASETRTATSVPTGAPDLVVARNAEPEELVRRSLDAFGGMPTFVGKGAWVIIKPNICVDYHTYEFAATTNPWVVAALVKLCLEAGAARVQVMDSPFGGTPESAYAKSGIAEQVQLAGGEMVGMPSFKFMETTIPQAKTLKKVKIFDDILKADVVINVPIAKTHSLSRLTLGMKNLMGTVADRPMLHRYLGQNLADLAGFIRPALTVLDAVRILTAFGPTGGNLDDVKKLDTLIVSPDIVAVDAYGATLFDRKPEELEYIQAGKDAGLGRSDLQNLRIEEINLGA